MFLVDWTKQALVVMNFSTTQQFRHVLHRRRTSGQMGQIMDLDFKFIDGATSSWARVGMLICFAIAAGILICSIWMPSTAKAYGPGFVHQRGL
jgi:hypothetical protein